MSDLSDPYFRVTQEWLDEEWEQQNADLAEIGVVLEEMMREAEIDVFHARRPTLAHRLAYITEHVAHGSDYSLLAASRELRRASLEVTGSVPSSVETRRAALARPRVGPTRTKRTT